MICRNHRQDIDPRQQPEVARLAPETGPIGLVRAIRVDHTTLGVFNEEALHLRRSIAEITYVYTTPNYPWKSLLLS